MSDFAHAVPFFWHTVPISFTGILPSCLIQQDSVQKSPYNKNRLLSEVPRLKYHPHLSLSRTLPCAFEVLLTFGNYLTQRSFLYLLLFSLLNGEWLLCFLLFNFFLKLISVKLTFFLLCHPWYVILCIDVWDLGSRVPLKFFSTFRVTALISRCSRVPSPLPSPTTKLLVLNLCSYRKRALFSLSCLPLYSQSSFVEWLNKTYINANKCGKLILWGLSGWLSPGVVVLISFLSLSP